jgi:hypothetical protein
MQLALRFVHARCAGPPLDRSLRTCVHFHPDRLVGGERILELIGRDGLYRSQFETGHSNGGLTAHPGGDRWKWESRIFGGCYDNAPPSDRPKYGALNFLRNKAGASPRFGSAHLRLAGPTLSRTTFCYPDSVFDPQDFGVADRMPLTDLARHAPPDPLDHYVEAHLHGPLQIKTDVEAIVLDPCFRGTDVELEAARLGCPVEWHQGFTLSVDLLVQHPTYRGPEIAELGQALAQDGRLDARILGEASRRGGHDPQALKKVWHCIARFGKPALTESPPM